MEFTKQRSIGILKILLVAVFAASVAAVGMAGHALLVDAREQRKAVSEALQEIKTVVPSQPTGYATNELTEPLRESKMNWRREDETCFLTDSQIEAVRFSYEYGKPYDLAYTLSAIALKESNGGKWKINLQDPSGGLYHVTVDKAVRELGYEDTPFNRNRAVQALVDDDNLAAKIAVQEILFWRDAVAGSWLDTWASYNHGWNGKNTERGKAYAEDIQKIIQQIQYCRWAY